MEGPNEARVLEKEQTSSFGHDNLGVHVVGRTIQRNKPTTGGLDGKALLKNRVSTFDSLASAFGL